MMKTYQRIMAVMLAGLVFGALSACEKEGPAEKAGKAIDEAATNISSEIGEVAESMEKKTEE